MKVQVLPKDQYGTIPAVIIGRVSVVWSWPRDRMVWFFWNRGGSYRVGPVTVIFNQNG